MTRKTELAHESAARRQLLTLGAGAAGFALLACGHKEAEVTPGEDLMQEHGVLERIVIIYDTAGLRIDGKQPLDPAIITKAAGIVRHFVEDYHERTEEKFVFPRLQAANRETALVAILLRQHQRGRELTDEIIRRANAGPSPELTQAMRNFSHMYRAHASREDTIVFPAFRDLFASRGSEYDELGEQFEEREHQLLGAKGFEGAVAEVAQLEQQLGIADLAGFTPA